MRSLSRVVLASAVLLPAIALLAARAGGQAASGRQHRSGIHSMRGSGPAVAPAATAAANPPAIPYNGGAVYPHPTVYALWWGSPADFPSDTQDGIDDFFHILNGTPYLALANQYLLGKNANVRFGGNFFDVSAPPTADPPTSEIVAEVYNVLTARGVKPDPTALYVVYPSISQTRITTALSSITAPRPTASIFT